MNTKINKQFIEKLELGKLINFEAEVQSFEIDSRKIKKGMGFVALPGETTDGHNYIKDAYQNGANLIIVSEQWWHKNQIKDLPLLITEKPAFALQKIATEYRKG